MMNSLRLAGIIVALGLVPMQAAMAQTAEEEGDRPALIQALYDCRQITEPSARLACYDRSVSEVEAADQGDDLVFADREQMREARRGLFGFNFPKIGLFSSDEDDDEQDEFARLETTLTGARVSANGKWIFVLEDGARWIQTDSTPILGSPGAGDRIEIEEAALGSYKAKINDRRAFRIKRVD